MKKEMENITVAICTYNRAGNLSKLVEALSRQESPIPYDILFVDNNSTDDTQSILHELAKHSSIPIRIVKEEQQGIPYARNRALEECMENTYLLFIDDDELPASTNMVSSAVKALTEEDAQCAGGRVTINFGDNKRPSWLTDELLPFYAELNHGDKTFWITDQSTPIWTSIVAYNMDIFRNNTDLRFDIRYNRDVNGIGGGSDGIMFRAMLERKIKMLYVPDMAIDHFVENWRISRKYFWKLHFIAGRKYGQFELENFDRTVLGIPPYMLGQFTRRLGETSLLLLKSDANYVRQGMNASYSLGMMYGRFLFWRTSRNSKQSI